MKGFIFIGAVALAIILVALLLPIVSAEENEVTECNSSDFILKIGDYNFSFDFSNNNAQPSLEYLICKYGESVDG